MTVRFSTDPSSLAEAAKLIQKGELIAFPTETVYGLGAGIFLPEAINRIFQAKGRPQDNPLIAHIGELAQVDLIAKDLPQDFYLLTSYFFPGPLTLVVSKKEAVPSIVSAGGKTIALRMPRHPVALQFINQCGFPLVAPSANLSGKPSSTTAEHVFYDFRGKIYGLIDGGPSEIGIESTVLSLMGPCPLLLRPGSVLQEEIEEVLGKKIGVATLEKNTPLLSPGMKYRHYAPDAKVLIFETPSELEAHLKKFPHCKRLVCTPTAKKFYAHLRAADAEQCEEICLLCDSSIQVQTGLMNRILKAAGEK